LAAVLREVDSYQPADQVDKENLASVRAQLLHVGDPFNRNNFVPGHLVASALIVSWDHRRVLLVRHPGLQRWLQPGGHVEGAELPRAAAAREAKEEAGLTLPAAAPGLLDVDVQRIPGTRREPPHTHYDLRYLFVDEVRAEYRDDPDVRWFTFGDFADMSDGGTRRMLRKVARLLTEQGAL
jgi:8-oxo-dGTP pyrophosphatase MutT (NUDIX family)